jgi:Protein of unknown function (DUF541)
MGPSGKIPRRLVMTAIACAVVLVVATATALAQSGSSNDPSAPANEQLSSTTIATAATASGSSTALPAWCCTSGSVPGLTATGQATIKDQGTAARDVAIADAVADATDQAQAAADAAGIHLGAVLEMQVSAMPVAYPMMGAANSGSGVAVGSTGSSSAGSEPGVTGPVSPVRYLGSATVTITWAIG